MTFSRVPCKQRKCKVIAEERVQRVLSLQIRDVSLADWSNVIFHIHDDCCWSEVFVCHFEMFAVGVRCVLFPSIHEATSYLEEEMASTFGRREVGWHPFLPMVSISFFAFYLLVFHLKISHPSHFTTCFCRPASVCISCWTSEKPLSTNENKTYVRR